MKLTTRYRFAASHRLHTPALSEEEKVQSLWWEGGFEASERVLFEEREETTEYLRGFVERESLARGFQPAPSRTTLVQHVRMGVASRLRRAR